MLVRVGTEVDCSEPSWSKGSSALLSVISASCRMCLTQKCGSRRYSLNDLPHKAQRDETLDELYGKWERKLNGLLAVARRPRRPTVFYVHTAADEVEFGSRRH